MASILNNNNIDATTYIKMITSINNIIDNYVIHKDKHKYLAEFIDSYSKITQHNLTLDLDILDKVITTDVDLVVNYLVNHSIVINDNLDNAICKASMWCSIATIKLLVILGADIATNNCSPLINAIDNRQNSIFINELVGMGGYIPSDTLDLQIITSLSNSNYDSSKFMIFVERGINMNIANGAILKKAINNNDVITVEKLLILGADPNIQSGNILYRAVNLCNETIAKLLLDHGANIKWIDAQLLARMANFCSNEFMQLLGKCGVDLSMLNDYDHEDIDTKNKIKYLAECGVDALKIAEIMSIIL